MHPEMQSSNRIYTGYFYLLKIELYLLRYLTYLFLSDHAIAVKHAL